MARERSSITPGKRPAPKTFRLSDEFFAPVADVGALFHGGTILRVFEDAATEYLIDKGYIPAARKAAAMPSPSTVRNQKELQDAFVDLQDLMNAMVIRLRMGSMTHFFLRPETQAQLFAALDQWPNVELPTLPGVPLPELTNTNAPYKLHVTTTQYVAIGKFLEDLARETPKASFGLIMREALLFKFRRLGLNTRDMWKTKARLTRPAFTHLPHPDGTYETRSLEERALALTFALYGLAQAEDALSLGLDALPIEMVDAHARLKHAFEMAQFEPADRQS